MISKTFLVAALIVAGVVAAAAYAGSSVPRGTGTTSTIMTTSTQCTTTSWSSTKATTSEGGYFVGTFRATPTSPVRIDSVAATVVPDGTGKNTLRFQVNYTNVGTRQIEVAAGCGGPLDSTIAPGGSVIQKDSGQVRCLCAEYLSPVNASQSRTALDPGCWSGYRYVVLQPGTFSASLTLSYYDAQTNTESHVTIVADFDLR